MPASGEFRLSITRALADQLADHLAALTPEPLDTARIDALERRCGIYQLYENGLLVYVGKAQRSLQTRLSQHHRKLIGRENVALPA